MSTSQPPSPDDLRLRPVADLLHERFFVPEYQRGYRWTPRQVRALLDDLDAFRRSARTADGYYCLQPIVVREREDGSWEVVDGQQRLTTLRLIFVYLADVAAAFGGVELYRLEYATRPGSEGYLDRPVEEGSEANIDFHHMWAAYQAIEEWFAEHLKRDHTLKAKLYTLLVSPDPEPGDRGQNVRVIWYELDRLDDPVQVFVRLNVGRIPLTSAELIRALLLRGDTPNAASAQDREHIARDWDLVERRLQDDAYWYFLHGGGQGPPARIEHIFDIFVRARAAEQQRAVADDPLATYLAFQAWFDAAEVGPWETWREVHRVANTLDEWFEDRTQYHLVGYLVAATPDTPGAAAGILVTLMEARNELTASAFELDLRRRIWRTFAPRRKTARSVGAEMLAADVEEVLSDLTYNSNPTRVRNTLLLFNVAGVLRKVASAPRFRFHAYKSESWDIEHVRSVAEYMPRDPRGQKAWLREARDFVCTISSPNAKLVTEIDELSEQGKPDDDRFELVFSEIRALSGEAEAREGNDDLSNLVLLDSETNRSYKNAVFPVKRRRIIMEMDRRGRFVLPGTRDVFLKYFSPNAAQLLLWDEDDQRNYDLALRGTLVDFFAPLATDEEVAS